MSFGFVRNQIGRRHTGVLVAFAAACLGGCSSDEPSEEQRDPLCRDDDVIVTELRRINQPRFLLVRGVSADGTVIYGSAGSEAFRWTEASGLVLSGALVGITSTTPVACSADGAVIVGTTGRGTWDTDQPFRWAAAGGVVSLGFRASGADLGWANDVSRDGAVITGTLNKTASSTPYGMIFRWTESDGLVVLDNPPDVVATTAVRMSADGSTIVGHSASSIDVPFNKVFRWTERTGSVHLDAPADAMHSASFVSDDGSVIVGASEAGESSVPFRWSERTGFTHLGSLPGFSQNRPTGMSADGSVVVGVSFNDPRSRFPIRAFRWTEAAGLTRLAFVPGRRAHQANSVIALSADGSTAIGVEHHWTDAQMSDLSSDLVVWDARGCATRIRVAEGPFYPTLSPMALSRDGRTIVGTASAAGSDASGWLIRLP
jgi:hypothetical protein